MAGVNVRRKGTGSPERMRACWLYGKLGHPARLSLGRLMKSQGFHQSADAQSRLPAAGSWERKAPTSCRRVASTSEGLPVPLSGLRTQAKSGGRSEADVQ